MEKYLSRTKSKDLVPTLYKGLIVNQVKCLTCKRTSDRPEPFYDILLQV